MIDAIGEKPTQPTPTGNAAEDAMAMEAYKVELPAYNRRLARYKAEAAERKEAEKSQQGLPPKAEAQAEAVVVEVDEAAEAAQKAEAEAEKAAAAERKRLREEERRKNDPILQKIAADKEARAAAKKKKEEEDALKAKEMEAKLEEKRMLEEMEAAEEAERAAAAKALEEAAAIKEAEAQAKVEKEQESALDKAMRRMFSREDAEERAAPPPMSSFGFVDSTGHWDDGGKCSDIPGGLILLCSRCGNRPRPAHGFRCRMHDEDMRNGDERPVRPRDLEDKMAMRRYEKDMDDWQPTWLKEDDDEPPALDDANAYSLHCPKCEGKTERHGADSSIEFSTSLRIIMNATEWLPSSYKHAMNAPEAVSERRFLTRTGLFGHCLKCKLLVQATVEKT